MSDYGGLDNDYYFATHEHDYSGKRGPNVGPIACFLGTIIKIIGLA